jgi:amino acid transporter
MVVALCYGEFGSSVSVTGGTFVYVTELFGRGVGW